MANHQNRHGYRHCNKCDVEFALTPEFFPLDRNRKCGFGYQCRQCANAMRRERGDLRTNRWTLMTDEQKATKTEWTRKYKARVGRAGFIVSAYKSLDKKRGHVCDIDAAWFREHIESKPCTYCGENQSIIGCDRIDNTHGHSRDNVVPCCWACNTARGDNFSHEEMKVIGRAISTVKAARVRFASAA